jgi:hypothetical protein
MVGDAAFAGTGTGEILTQLDGKTTVLAMRTQGIPGLDCRVSESW